MVNEETIFDRQLRPIVEREALTRPAPDTWMRIMPSVAADPRQLAAEMRERINPAYANQAGTESHERRLCAEAIESLLHQRDELLAKREEGDRLILRLTEERAEAMAQRDELLDVLHVLIAEADDNPFTTVGHFVEHVAPGTRASVAKVTP